MALSEHITTRYLITNRVAARFSQVGGEERKLKHIFSARRSDGVTINAWELRNGEYRFEMADKHGNAAGAGEVTGISLLVSALKSRIHPDRSAYDSALEYTITLNRLGRQIRSANQDDDEAALDALADHWADVFLDELAGNTQIDGKAVAQVLQAKGISADDINRLVPEGTKEAGVGTFVRVLGGLILRGLWHMLVHPFLAIGKLIRSSSFRNEVKTSFKRALKHEVRASKHMLSVAGRLARGEEVRPQERKAAMRQLVQVLTKSVLLYFIGPHISHLFAGGIWKALAALLSPINDVMLVLLDKPIRAAAKKLMQADIGLMPSGFYTHI